MKRLTVIDLTRGFTVLFIPIIHCVMLYSTKEVQSSIYGQALRGIAEWPGAQVLMLMMGVSFPLSNKISAKRILIKAGVLLTLGYLLNYLKFLLPIETGIMPKEFLAEYAGGGFTQLQFLLIGDILHFAAIALLILFLLHRFRSPIAMASLLVVIVLLISPIFWDIKSNNILANHFLSLFFGKPPHTYFPAFPWLIYPLTGLTIGITIKNYLRYHFFHELLTISAIVCLTISVLQYKGLLFRETSFYRTLPDASLNHLAFAVEWFALWYYFSKVVKWNWLINFLTFLSKNITIIYLIQWVLIFGCFPLFGYHRQGLLSSIIISLSAAVVTLLITLLISAMTKKEENEGTLQQQSSITKKHVFIYEPSDDL